MHHLVVSESELHDNYSTPRAIFKDNLQKKSPEQQASPEQQEEARRITGRTHGCAPTKSIHIIPMKIFKSS